MDEPSEQIEVLKLASGIEKEWVNFIAARVDDYVIRVIVQETTSRWHHHPKDELFLVLQGKYSIDLEDRTVELHRVKCLLYRKWSRTGPAQSSALSLSASNRRPTNCLVEALVILAHGGFIRGSTDAASSGLQKTLRKRTFHHG